MIYLHGISNNINTVIIFVFILLAVMGNKSLWCLLAVVALATWTNGQGKPCKLRSAKYGNICVCTADYCDTLENIEPGNVGSYVLVSTSEGQIPFLVRRGLFNVSQGVGSRGQANVNIDTALQYQEICGFGGALTGTVSYILDSVPVDLQNHIFTSYYSASQGVGYTMMRMSIGGSDFDMEPWAYNELPANDVTLSNFTAFDPRDVRKIEQIRAIKNVTNISDIKIFGSAWSPPPWMKSNNAWTGFSSLLEKYYQTWADYHVKFLELMSDEEIPVWAISTGNEPLNGVIGWMFVKFMSLGWTPAKQGKWVSQNLGHTIRNSKNEDVRKVKIFTGDDQRYTFPWWMRSMASAYADSIDYIDGMAVHWYWDQIVPPSLLDQAHAAYPDKLLLNTESCDGDKPLQTHGPELGSWPRAEKYILAYMQDLNHWVNGWIDWNLVLDEQGGPNYAKNFVESAVVVNMTNKNEFYKQPMFYGIGHFSRFIVEGSVRVAANSDNGNVVVLAFKRPDQSNIVIFYNKSKKKISTKFTDEQRGQIWIDLPPKSIHTLHYKYNV